MFFKDLFCRHVKTLVCLAKGKFQLFYFVIFLRKLNPSPDDKILDWSKLKEIADDILKCVKIKQEGQDGPGTLT